MVDLPTKLRDVEAALAARTLPPAIAEKLRAGVEARAAWDAETEKLKRHHADLQAAVAARKSEAEFERERAAREERERQITAAEAALRAAADEYIATYRTLVGNMQAAADGIGRTLAQMRVIGQLGTALSVNGRAPTGCSVQQLESDLALLIAASLKTVPGHKFRLGSLTWPSAADAHFPPGADWAGKEEARVLTQIVQPLTNIED